MRFGFKVFKNVAKYEALIVGFRLTKEMQVKMRLISNDSQMVVSQVNDNFIARNKGMIAYHKQVVDLLPSFEKFELTQTFHLKSAYADAL